AGFFDDSAPFAPVRELELHTFYQLGGQRIDMRTFKIAFRRGSDDPPITTIQSPSGVVPYLEVVGLDNLNEKDGFPVQGHDQLLDGTSPTSPSARFVDETNGILFLPDPRPFAPRLIGPDAKPFDQAVSHTLFRRDSL